MPSKWGGKGEWLKLCFRRPADVNTVFVRVGVRKIIFQGLTLDSVSRRVFHGRGHVKDGRAEPGMVRQEERLWPKVPGAARRVTHGAGFRQAARTRSLVPFEECSPGRDRWLSERYCPLNEEDSHAKHPIVSLFAAPVLAGVARQRSSFRSGSRLLATPACQHGLRRSVYCVETWGQPLTQDVKVLRPSPHDFERFRVNGRPERFTAVPSLSPISVLPDVWPL
jgi:hypothetical protein